MGFYSGNQKTREYGGNILEYLILLELTTSKKVNLRVRLKKFAKLVELRGLKFVSLMLH